MKDKQQDMFACCILSQYLFNRKLKHQADYLKHT